MSTAFSVCRTPHKVLFNISYLDIITVTLFRVVILIKGECIRVHGDCYAYPTQITKYSSRLWQNKGQINRCVFIWCHLDSSPAASCLPPPLKSRWLRCENILHISSHRSHNGCNIYTQSVSLQRGYHFLQIHTSRATSTTKKQHLRSFLSSTKTTMKIIETPSPLVVAWAVHHHTVCHIINPRSTTCLHLHASPFLCIPATS